jgi:aminopeptidase N
MKHAVFNHLARARVVAVALIVAFTCADTIGQGPATVAANQPPPYQWPRSHDYDIQHYRLVLSLDWKEKSIAGDETITFRPLRSDLQELEIDAGAMTIKSVNLLQGTPLKFRYVGSEKLFVTLDRAYPTGTDVSITITYGAASTRGLTFITPTESDPHQRYQIWSQGEAQTNHYWFPCYDYPNDKATSELIATVDQKFQVLSNGVLVANALNPSNKTRTYHWKMDKPYSSYLTSIIVGEFAEVRDKFKDTPVISYVYPDQVENARLSFAKLGTMVKFFSEKIGVDFPYGKYAEATVRDFGGGMENITLTTITDTAVHDRRAHIDNSGSTDSLISHELAHSWFGNLLTCRDWGELWLNESFATFFDAIWNEHDHGREDYLYQMYNNQQQYFQSWFQFLRRPIATKRYFDPDALFDTYAYSRGAAVLNMLRFVLGDEPFWKAISHYVKKHQFENVETQQLVIAIEEATGQNLQWFFDEWVYKMGHPEFEISSSFDEPAKSLKVSIKQTQQPDDKRPWYQSAELFTMPVDIAITTASGEKIHRVWIDGREKEFTFQIDSKPLIVNFDRGNYLIKRTKFNRGDDELAYQLLHDQDVMGRVQAAIALRSHNSGAAVKALADAVAHDRFWGVRLQAVKSLSELKTDAARSALIDASKDSDPLVRREAVQGLGALKDPALADLFINLINTDESYFVVSYAASALGQSGSPKAFDALAAAMKMDSWDETIRVGVLRGLTWLKDPRALDIAFKFSSSENHGALRMAAFPLLAVFGKGNDRAFQILKTALTERSQQIRLAAVQSLGAIGDARALPLLEELSKSPELPPQGRQAIAIAIGQIKLATRHQEQKDN